MMLRNLVSMSTLNLFKAGIQFVISAAMTLYVVPAEYGLITFSLPIIQFIALFTDMGLASAIIRQDRLTDEEVGATLSFSLAVALVAGGLLAASAMTVERLSRLYGLHTVLFALSAALFFSIAAGVPRALMERALEYQRVALLEGAATVAATVACLASLPFGGGIWSVVAFHVVLQSFRAGAFLVSTRHQISLSPLWGRVHAMLSFGGWVLATNLVNFLGRNAQNLLIGAWLGAAAVGLYGLSYQFMILPLVAMSWPASGVLMASLSRLNATGQAYDRPVLAVSTVTAMIAFPAMAYLTFGLAWPIQRLLSAHWAMLAPLLTTLAPLGALQSLASYNGAVLIARGHSRLQFYVNALGSLALVGGFVAALPFGLDVFARAYLLVGTLVALGQIGAKLWGAGIPIGTYVRAIAPAVVAPLVGIALAAVVGLRAHSWIGWAAASFVYAGGVVIAYVAFRRTLTAAALDLLGERQDARALAGVAVDEQVLHGAGGPSAPPIAA